MEPDTSKGQSITVPGWIELKVSIGNLLTIGVILVGGIAGYVRLDARVTSNEVKLSTAEVVFMRKDLATAERDRVDSQFTDLKAQLNRIENKLDNLK